VLKLTLLAQFVFLWVASTALTKGHELQSPHCKDT